MSMQIILRTASPARMSQSCCAHLTTVNPAFAFISLFSPVFLSALKKIVGHFNQAGPYVVRAILQHTDIWPQRGGSGAPSCQGYGSGEMSLSLIVLCFSVLHASEFHFLCLNMFCQGEKRAHPKPLLPSFWQEASDGMWLHGCFSD